MNDIARERQMVEQNSPEHYPTSNDEDELTIEEEHRHAQESGEVFEGGRAGAL